MAPRPFSGRYRSCPQAPEADTSSASIRYAELSKVIPKAMPPLISLVNSPARIPDAKATGWVSSPFIIRGSNECDTQLRAQREILLMTIPYVAQGKLDRRRFLQGAGVS